MLMEKLARGVLRLQTPLGPRFVAPTFWQRIYLLWMFRNFQTLPLQVLTARQLRFLDRVCSDRPSYRAASGSLFELPVLGTLESPPAASGAQSGRTSEDVSPFAADSGPR
jgi:hypothetical protein